MMLMALGLMSGTSLDGVDVALIETDGRQIKAFGPTGYRPYTDGERSLLRRALTEAVHLSRRDARPGVLRQAEQAITTAHAEAVASFTAQTRISAQDIDIVGFHGQTVLHRPERKLTVQIGDALALAKAIHIPVMYDFRAADVEAGGQGAPLVPVYHRALAQSLNREGPTVVANIGGVSNITYIDGTDTLIACDTGPGNALLDDFMFRQMHQPFDTGGKFAALGRPDEGWIAQALKPGAGNRRTRRGARLGGGCDRGAGLRFPGRARHEGAAAELPRHHGGADPDDRGHHRATVI